MSLAGIHGGEGLGVWWLPRRGGFGEKGCGGKPLPSALAPRWKSSGRPGLAAGRRCAPVQSPGAVVHAKSARQTAVATMAKDP